MSLNNLSQMDIPILSNLISPFPSLGLLGGIFHFCLNFDRASVRNSEDPD